MLLVSRPFCLAFGIPEGAFIFMGMVYGLTALIKEPMFFRIATNKMVGIWAILIFYHFFNALYCRVPDTDYHVFLNCAKTTILLACTTYAFVEDEKKCMKFLIAGYSIFLLLCMTSMSLLADNDNRLTSEGIHTNQIGQCAGIFAIIGAIYYHKDKKKTLILFSPPIVISFLTQTRNSLGMIVFGLLITFYDVIKKQKWYVLASLALAYVILIPYLTYFIDNFGILQRFQANSSNEQLDYFFETHGYTRTNTILDNILGERIVYYILGWEDFISSPINGIGLWNFQHLHFGYPIHSEYIVHLAEGGLIGFTLYAFFIGNILNGLHFIDNKFNIRHQYIIAITTILFVSITARIFMCEFVFPLYGCIIGYIIRNSNFYEKYGEYYDFECCVCSNGIFFGTANNEPYDKLDDAIWLWCDTMEIEPGDRNVDEMIEFINNYEYEDEETFFQISLTS